MGIHCVTYYAEPDARECVDVAYQCSARCMADELERTAELNIDTIEPAGTENTEDDGSVSWGAYPCGDETDYDVYCSVCEALLWRGLDWAESAEVSCAWFAMCENTATGTLAHPILGDVPICDRCRRIAAPAEVTS